MSKTCISNVGMGNMFALLIFSIISKWHFFDFIAEDEGFLNVLNPMLAINLGDDNNVINPFLDIEANYSSSVPYYSNLLYENICLIEAKWYEDVCIEFKDKALLDMPAIGCLLFCAVY